MRPLMKYRGIRKIGIMTKNEFSALTSWQERIKSTGKPVYIYGMGNGADKILRQLDRLGVRCSGVFASDAFARHNTFHGMTVTTLAEAEKQSGDMMILLGFGSSLPDVMAHIDSIADRHELIAPEVSVIGDGAFEKEVFLDRFEEAQAAYDRLDGEASRACFELLTKFKITGDLEWLRQAFTISPADKDRFECGAESAVILDLGAYNGDTALELASACKGYSRLIAVEPEKKNFQKLIRNTAALDSIEYINAAAWSHECELSFCSSAGRMAAVGDGGKTVRAVSVDGLLGSGRCDLIKYDVEGADKEAILGSKDTIRRWCPKICTAVYHRPYDYFELINLIGGIRPDYSFRLTQDVYYPAWETNITAYI